MYRATIDGERTELVLDSGASVILIDESAYEEIYKGKEKPLKQARRRIYSYGSSSPLPLLKAIEAEIAEKSNSISATLHVVKGRSGNLLGYDTVPRGPVMFYALAIEVIYLLVLVTVVCR